jgi:hypothetical protein
MASPDAWFDRQWGLAILDRALSALAAEQTPRTFNSSNRG